MTAIELAIEALQESLEFFQSYSVGAMSRNNAESMALEALPKVTAALAALRAQPEPIAHFSVMGNPISPHRELIAELRKPMHYLSMAKRNRAADALEGKTK